MYLSRIRLNRTRIANLWASNPYRVHQRLMMACDGDPRLLFRIEDAPDGSTQILVQSVNPPNWAVAFADFPVLLTEPEQKPLNPSLEAGRRYRFRLLANPTIKTMVAREGEVHKTRQGLLREIDQVDWLRRKLEASGAELPDCRVVPRGFQHSHKNSSRDEGRQTHLAVLFEGILTAKDPAALRSALEAGIGPAKGYGFGLLSLAPASF